MIYFDNAATTKICPEALAVYNEVSLAHFGNPSSLHAVGFDAEKILSAARAAILSTLGTDGTVVFTSSGSEGNNLSIFGRAYAKERYRRGAKILTTAGEHASVDAPLDKLAKEGFTVKYIPTENGELDFEFLKKELTPDVILVSAMLVNNETGALYDVPALSRAVKAACPSAILHVDATQGYMKVPFTAKSLGADLITVSSHKIEGPKGIGALYVSNAVLKEKGLSPIIFGGGQEGHLRSGTENVPGIAAFAEAAKIAFGERAERIQKTANLRALFIEQIATREGLSEIKPILPRKAAPHILNLTLPGIKSETMLHFLSSEGFCVSSGSACSSNGTHHSGALTAFGRTVEEADTSIRVSFSHRNTEEEVFAFCDALERGLQKLSRIKGGYTK